METLGGAPSLLCPLPHSQRARSIETPARCTCSPRHPGTVCEVADLDRHRAGGRDIGKPHEPVAGIRGRRSVGDHRGGRAGHGGRADLASIPGGRTADAARDATQRAQASRARRTRGPRCTRRAVANVLRAADLARVECAVAVGVEPGGGLDAAAWAIRSRRFRRDADQAAETIRTGRTGRTRRAVADILRAGDLGRVENAVAVCIEPGSRLVAAKLASENTGRFCGDGDQAVEAIGARRTCCACRPCACARRTVAPSAPVAPAVPLQT